MQNKNYEWYDNIDGNSFIESYKAGNLFNSGKSFISNTVEGVWDIVMDKIAGVDYKIIIKGNTSISDRKFPGYISKTGRQIYYHE